MINRAKLRTEANGYIPVVGNYRSGPPVDFVNSGYPVSYGDYYCKIPREGELYGLRLDRDLLGWMKGDVIILDPSMQTTSLKVGSSPHKEVLLRKIHDSEATICRLNKLTSEVWEESWEISHGH